MRIGFLGNANNYPFMLARRLRQLGHDVQFIVCSEERLDRPEFRYSDISFPYPEWLHDLPLTLVDWAFPTLARYRAIKILNSCDALILNQLGPTLLPSISRPSIVLLTGTDLLHYCDPATSARV
ncbi:MAG: hypothetical protein WCG75_06860, partial [Armatimonadota bacterium]